MTSKGNKDGITVISLVVEWKTSGIQIVSTLIGSGILLTAFSSFYNEIYNKPHLNIAVQGNRTDVHRDIVTVTNDGRMSATNLDLKIHTPAGFSLIDNFSTSENMLITKINSTLLSVHLPTFVEGEGSTIRIVMNLNYTGVLLGGVVNSVEPGSIAQSIGISKGSVIQKIAGQDLNNLSNFRNILQSNLGKKIQINWLRKTGQYVTSIVSLPPAVQPGKRILGVVTVRSPGDYTVLGTYNEGSTREVFVRVPCSLFIPQWYTVSYGSKTYQEYLNFKDELFTYLLFPFLFAVSIIFFTLPQIFKKLFRTLRRDQIKFLSSLIEEMISVRSALKTNIFGTNNFTEKWTSVSYDTKRQVIGNISNYLLVDDFYTQLIKRNLYVLNSNKKVDNDELAKYNEECVRLAEKALKNIEWKKYTLTSHTTKKPHRRLLETTLIAFIGGTILPGLGHIYIGRWKRGIIIMLVYYLMAFLFVEGIDMQYESFYMQCSEPTFAIIVMTYLYFGMIGIWIWQGLDARRLVKLNKQQR